MTYDLEKTVAAGIEAVLTRAAGLPVFTRFSEDDDARDLPAERIEATAYGFQQASEQMNFAPVTGSPYYCHFSGTVDVAVMTRRKGKTTETHDAAVSRVRHLFSREAQAFTARTFPDFEVLSIRLNASTPSMKDEDEIDMTGLSFAIELSILPTAL